MADIEMTNTEKFKGIFSEMVDYQGFNLFISKMFFDT
jgi:hypothetical protein